MVVTGEFEFDVTLDGDGDVQMSWYNPYTDQSESVWISSAALVNALRHHGVIPREDTPDTPAKPTRERPRYEDSEGNVWELRRDGKLVALTYRHRPVRMGAVRTRQAIEARFGSLTPLNTAAQTWEDLHSRIAKDIYVTLWEDQ